MSAVQGLVEEPPSFQGIDPYARENVVDPHRFQHALRDAAPVVTLSDYGVYSTGRYEEIRQVLNDWQNFSSAAGVGIQDVRKPGKFRLPVKLTEEDPPYHTQVRSAVTKMLSRLIRSWRETFEAEARAIVAKILDLRTFDGMEDLVETYLLKVFSGAIGIDLPRQEVLAISEMRLNQSGPDNPLYQRAMVQAEPFLDWFERSVDRQVAKPGSIADQLYQAEDRGEILEGTAQNLTRTFIAGGVNSTMTGLGGCFFHLAANPDQMKKAVGAPDIMRTALDEGIRLETPFRVVYRTLTKDVELSGYGLKKDNKLGLWLGAGNRDPRKWERPDAFDLSRNIVGVHVAFGGGIHVCIGQMLARLEAECLLTEFARRVRTVEFDGEVVRRPMNTMCSFAKIPLRVTPQ